MDSIVQSISTRVRRHKGWAKRFNNNQKKKKKDKRKNDGDDAEDEGPKPVVGPALSLLRTRKKRSAQLGTRVVVGSIQAYSARDHAKALESKARESKARSKSRRPKNDARTVKKKKKEEEEDEPRKTPKAGKKRDKHKKRDKKRDKKREKKKRKDRGVRSIGGNIRSVSKQTSKHGRPRKSKADGMLSSVLSMLDSDVAKTQAEDEMPLDKTARDMQELHAVYQEIQGTLGKNKITRRDRKQRRNNVDLDLEEAASIIDSGFKKTSFKPGRNWDNRQSKAHGFSFDREATGADATAADATAVHDGGCTFDFSSPSDKAGRATTGPRKLPTLFFNSKKLKPLLEAFVHGGRKCPELVLVDGPSGCGKSWTLNQIATYWKQCTSPANVLTNENFEQAVEQNLPFPNDTAILLVLDDVDTLMPKALERLKKLLDKKKKALKKDSHGMHILMSATDVFAQQRHSFLRTVPKRVTLYKSTYSGPLTSFVESLKLQPKPPIKFVRRVIQLCNGNLHRLKNMLRCHRSTKTLAAGNDAFNVWQEQDLFKQGKLSKPPSEKCALMTVFNAPDNMFSLEQLAELTDRFSESLSLHDPWVFQVHDLRVLGKEKKFPSKYLALNSAKKRLNDIYPNLCRFFEEWGFESSCRTMPDRLAAMVKFWEAERTKLKKDFTESRRILEITGLSVDWLKSMDRVMRDRQIAFEIRDRDMSDELDEMQLKFLMG